MKTLKERTEIQQAKLDGEEIECSFLSCGEWADYFGDDFNWNDFDFRVKPKPMEIWAHFYNNGGITAFETKEKAVSAIGFSTETEIEIIKFIQAPDEEQ